MPTLNPIVLGTKTYSPAVLTAVSVELQNLAQTYGKRDKLLLDRNVDEEKKTVLRRVVRVHQNVDIGTAELPQLGQQAGTVTLVFPQGTTAAQRLALLDELVLSLKHVDVRASVSNPEWFY